MRHEEAGAFAAAAEASFTGNLTACAGTCGPGSLHFINGLYEANRNRAPVLLIATQIVRHDIGFDSIQEVKFDEVFKGCSVFCETILTPDQARRKAVRCLSGGVDKARVAVLVVPADVANADAPKEAPYAVHVTAAASSVRATRISTKSRACSTTSEVDHHLCLGAGRDGAHDEVVAAAARLKAPMAHASRGRTSSNTTIHTTSA